MASGSYTKQPPPSSSNKRKSRWGPTAATTTTTTVVSSSSSAAATTFNPLPNPKPNNPISKNQNPSSNPNPSPSQPIKLQLPPLLPPPPPTYGFHMLERRTIILADGSVRSYFALPPDYQDFPLPRAPHVGPGPGPGQGLQFPPMSPEGLGLGLGFKRKLGNSEAHNVNSSLIADFYNQLGSASNSGSNHHHHHNSSNNSNNVGEGLRPGKYMRVGNGESNVGVGVRAGGGSSNDKYRSVDQSELKKAFLRFVKEINENETEMRRYLENGKLGRLYCLACGRSSKDFPNTHALVMHAYNTDSSDSRVNHLGLHKALCILMGWNYSKAPDNTKSYQLLTPEEAASNQDDLILWPPLVIIHNTATGKGKDDRMEGLGNKVMDNRIRDLGITGGKSKTLYSREGHLGITLIKFPGDVSGLREAQRLAEHFEKENHGRKDWERIQPVTIGLDGEKNPNLVKIERSGDRKRVLYGHIATAADMMKVDFETRKKVVIESRKGIFQS